jgi:hypothetical protein
MITYQFHIHTRLLSDLGVECKALFLGGSGFCRQAGINLFQKTIKNDINSKVTSLCNIVTSEVALIKFKKCQLSSTNTHNI